MTSAALAIALTLSAAAVSPTLPQGGGAVQLVRDACIGTDLERAAFERLGRERRWRPVRMTQISGESGWNVAFRTGSVTIMMMGDPANDEAEPAAGVVCSVSVERASPALEGEVAAFAASLGLDYESAGAGTPAGFVPIRIWSRLGDRTITYAAAADGRAVISLSRQIVTHQPDPVSPSFEP